MVSGHPRCTCAVVVGFICEVWFIPHVDFPPAQHCWLRVLVCNSPPPPLPCLFPLICQCDRCRFFCLGAHSWVVALCQPWGIIQTGGWLPKVEAPGYFRHPTSILKVAVVYRCLTTPPGPSFLGFVLQPNSD